MMKNFRIACAWLSLSLLAAGASLPAASAGAESEGAAGRLKLGWASADITPDKSVVIAGGSAARVSEGVSNHIYATALAIESTGNSGPSDVVIMVSLDLVGVTDILYDRARQSAAGEKNHHAPPGAPPGSRAGRLTEAQFLRPDAKVRMNRRTAARRQNRASHVARMLDAIPSPAIVLNSKRQTIAANLALRKMFDVEIGERRSIMGCRRAIVAEFDRWNHSMVLANPVSMARSAPSPAFPWPAGCPDGGGAEIIGRERLVDDQLLEPVSLSTCSASSAISSPGLPRFTGPMNP